MLEAHDSALKHVDRTLEKLLTGGTEKRPLQELLSGVIIKLSVPITSETSTPIPLWSKSGVKAVSVSHLTLGFEQSFFDGNC
jgi:hypothetical protein